MSDPLQDYYLSYIHPCQGLLLLTPSRAPQTTAAPSCHPSKAFVGVKKIKHYPNVWGYWGGSQVSGFGFNLEDYILGVQEKGSLVIPPISRVTEPNPTPARTSKPPPQPPRLS